jgi:hypothetical protein
MACVTGMLHLYPGAVVMAHHYRPMATLCLELLPACGYLACLAVSLHALPCHDRSPTCYSAKVCGDDSCYTTWVQVGRHGAMMAGCQVRPGANGCLGNPAALIGTDPWRLWTELRGASSLAIAYSPASSTPGAACDVPGTQLASGICVPVPMRFLCRNRCGRLHSHRPHMQHVTRRILPACRAGRIHHGAGAEGAAATRAVLLLPHGAPCSDAQWRYPRAHGIDRDAACFAQAAQRLCRNPLEDESVVGITNYINIGLQARMHLAAP